MTTTTTKITPTGKSDFPVFYLRADWAQASATVMVLAGPDDADPASDTWHAMQPNQVADYGHDFWHAALAIIREWNEGEGRGAEYETFAASDEVQP